MRVELSQVAPKSRDTSSNLETMTEHLRMSSAELLVYPELFLSGYQLDGLSELSLTQENQIFRELEVLCTEQETSLIFGFVEQEEGHFYDSCAVIDWRSGTATTVRKTHLFGAENNVFSRGQRLEPVEVNGVALGILNCVEIEYPEVARTLTLRGSQALIVISANMWPYVEEHDVACKSRVFENNVPLAYVNRIGEESGFKFCGETKILNSRGQVLERVDSGEPYQLVGEIVIDQPPDEDLNQLTWRRPELYEC